MPLSNNIEHTRQLALQIAPKVASGLSIVGSSMILYDVYQRYRYTSQRSRQGGGRRQRQRQQHSGSSGGVTTDNGSHIITPRHRLLVGVCVYDILYSIAVALSTLPMPRDSGIPGSRGNQLTCNIQGAMAQLWVGVTMYEASIMTYFLLVIRFGVTDTWMEQNYVEPIMHLLSCGWAFGTAITAWIMKFYNPLFSMCWIGSYPRFCAQSYMGLDDDEGQKCTRGDNSKLYALAFLWIPVWIVLLYMLSAMAAIYCKIASLEQTTKRWEFPMTATTTRPVVNAPPPPPSPSPRLSLEEEGDMSATNRTISSWTISSRLFHPSSANNTIPATTAPSSSSPPSSLTLKRNSNSMARRFAVQSLFYVTAYLLTISMWSVYQWVWLLSNKNNPILNSWWYNFIASITTAFHGFINMLVYFRRGQPQRRRSNQRSHSSSSNAKDFGGVFFQYRKHQRRTSRSSQEQEGYSSRFSLSGLSALWDGPSHGFKHQNTNNATNNATTDSHNNITSLDEEIHKRPAENNSNNNAMNVSKVGMLREILQYSSSVEASCSEEEEDSDKEDDNMSCETIDA